MKISKKDALTWFEFFASLDEEEELMPKQLEIVYSTFAQIEDTVERHHRELMDSIPGLKSLEGRTLYVGDDAKFPIGCRQCLFGSGLCAIRKTNRCNLSCKFCYDYGELDMQPPIGEEMWEIGGTRFREEDIDLLLAVQSHPTGVCYVYLEPFMEIDKYYDIIAKFHSAGIHQHLYTNGTLVTKDNLKMLREAGLDELRFNLGATNCSDLVTDNMEMACEYIPYVGIETPMTPEFFDSFLQKKDRILSTGIDFINCAELHLNENNIYNYEGEDLYISRLGYISPIFSRDLTFQFMEIAGREKWNIVVHDCSNHTKFARDLAQGGRESGWFGASSYGCEFDQFPYWAFLPVLRDDNFEFLKEEDLPEGYRPGDEMF